MWLWTQKLGVGKEGVIWMEFKKKKKNLNPHHPFILKLKSDRFLGIKKN